MTAVDVRGSGELDGLVPHGGAYKILMETLPETCNKQDTDD